jgi:hypothetical protein
VDIDLAEKPKVILITDVLRKAYSMLDPYSDSIQILGRFRNGIENAVHISNFNSGLKWKEKARAVTYIKDAHKAYRTLKTLKETKLQREDWRYLPQGWQPIQFIRT